MLLSNSKYCVIQILRREQPPFKRGRSHAVLPHDLRRSADHYLESNNTVRFGTFIIIYPEQRATDYIILSKNIFREIIVLAA